MRAFMANPKGLKFLKKSVEQNRNNSKKKSVNGDLSPPLPNKAVVCTDSVASCAFVSFKD